MVVSAIATESSDTQPADSNSIRLCSVEEGHHDFCQFHVHADLRLDQAACSPQAAEVGHSLISLPVAELAKQSGQGFKDRRICARNFSCPSTGGHGHDETWTVGKLQDVGRCMMP